MVVRGIPYKSSEPPSRYSTDQMEAKLGNEEVGQNHTLLVTHIRDKLLLYHSDPCMEIMCCVGRMRWS